MGKAGKIGNYPKPERFTPEEIEAGVELFLRHVPGHVIAAARLAGYPVEGSLRKNDTET